MNSRRKWLPKLIEGIGYRFADGIITSSKRNFEYVEKNYNPSGIHALIPNYVETEVFKPLNGNKKKGSICFVGRLSREKNLFALLEALKGLPCTLSIIGSGEQEEQLMKFAYKNEVNANFLGNMPNHELPEIINQHELFILPSFYENMPKTLLEAMACGLPVIGTDVKGINEVIEHRKNGIICNTDPDSIRVAIVTLMGDEELKQELGENARKTIVENYSLPMLAEKELKMMVELTR